MSAPNAPRGQWKENGPQTTCKVCGLSVFTLDSQTWVNGPVPGIAHTECAEKETIEE